ncbi:MAG: 16S rRNA (guanine(527)-N(7))-methyltransferase RsmG [Anaerolineaceae bacterium]|jgi:16S rRNA (guanine527-N7)-methyltransferase
MNHWLEELETGFGLTLSARQVEQFERYTDILLEWNARFNLTGFKDKEAIQYWNFLDSLSVIKALEREKTPASLIDVGTGAGFPGIPLKIYYPDAKLTLVESIGKKANFCVHICEQLELSNCLVLPKRAEEVGQDPAHREQYMLAIARAVAAMPVLLEYLLPLTKPGGLVVMQRGVSGEEEAILAEEIMRKLGGDLESIVDVEFPMVNEKRCLVKVRKNARTPAKYPRETGVPLKRPLR